MMSRTSDSNIQITPPSSQTKNDENRNLEEEIKDAQAFTSTIEDNMENRQKFSVIRENGFVKFCWDVVAYTPRRCRYDAESPPEFSMGLNLLFAFVSWFLFENG